MFVIVSLAMVGLPLINGFVGEFLILSSTFASVSHGWAVAATVGVILSAAYMLWLVQRVFYGPESKLSTNSPAEDLRIGEQSVLWPMAVLMLVMGVAPNLWFRDIQTAEKPILLQQSKANEMLNQPNVVPGVSSGEVRQ
jgi:NADH-quinone oxidoreductase subunit M